MIPFLIQLITQTPTTTTGSILDNSTFLVVLATMIASIIATLASTLVAQWINKKKIPSEVKQIDANTDFKQSEIADKYREISSKTADENLELINERNKLRSDLEDLRKTMLANDAANKKVLEELRQSFQAEIERGKRFEDWARRLVLELQAWCIEPVPFDIEEAKQLKINERKAEKDSDFMNKERK
jgi:hypothetical protein